MESENSDSLIDVKEHKLVWNQGWYVALCLPQLLTNIYSKYKTCKILESNLGQTIHYQIHYKLYSIVTENENIFAFVAEVVCHVK